MEGIRDFEKSILEEIDFIDKDLDIKLQFVRNNSDETLKCDNKTFMNIVEGKYKIQHQGGALHCIKDIQ